MSATVHDDHTGITFRETMAGGFKLGVTDPALGAAGPQQLAMHATIQIADIDAFTHSAGTRPSSAAASTSSRWGWAWWPTAACSACSAPAATRR